MLAPVDEDPGSAAALRELLEQMHPPELELVLLRVFDAQHIPRSQTTGPTTLTASLRSTFAAPFQPSQHGRGSRCVGQPAPRSSRCRVRSSGVVVGGGVPILSGDRWWGVGWPGPLPLSFSSPPSNKTGRDGAPRTVIPRAVCAPAFPFSPGSGPEWVPPPPPPPRRRSGTHTGVMRCPVRRNRQAPRLGVPRAGARPRLPSRAGR